MCFDPVPKISWRPESIKWQNERPRRGWTAKDGGGDGGDGMNHKQPPGVPTGCLARREDDLGPYVHGNMRLTHGKGKNQRTLLVLLRSSSVFRAADGFPSSQDGFQPCGPASAPPSAASQDPWLAVCSRCLKTGRNERGGGAPARRSLRGRSIRRRCF